MWFFFFAFAVFMLPNSASFWLGTEFIFLLDFLSTRNLLQLLQLVLDRAGTLTSATNFPPEAHPKRSSFPREGFTQMTKLRVPLTCFHHSLTMLSHCSLFSFNTRSNCALSVFFTCGICFALLQSTLAQTLFCLIVYILGDPFFWVCLWRFEIHGWITCCKISNLNRSPISGPIWKHFFDLLLLLLLSSVVTHTWSCRHSRNFEITTAAAAAVFLPESLWTPHTPSKH